MENLLSKMYIEGTLISKSCNIDLIMILSPKFQYFCFLKNKMIEEAKICKKLLRQMLEIKQMLKDLNPGLYVKRSEMSRPIMTSSLSTQHQHTDTL